MFHFVDEESLVREMKSLTHGHRASKLVFKLSVPKPEFHKHIEFWASIVESLASIIKE